MLKSAVLRIEIGFYSGRFPYLVALSTNILLAFQIYFIHFSVVYVCMSHVYVF